METLRFVPARGAWLVLLLLGLLTGLGAQPSGMADQMAKLKVNDETLAKIAALVAADEGAQTQARAEIKVLQAQLSKLLLDKAPSEAEAEKILRASAEWEVKMRLVQVRRHLKIRDLLGNGPWARLYKLSREWAQAERANAEALVSLEQTYPGLVAVLKGIQ